MDLPNRLTQNHQTVRIASAIGLAAVAVRSFMKGNRLRGVLAASGAVAVGATASTLEPTELEIDNETESTKSTKSAKPTEAGRLECSTCNDPIVPGQSRRPNEANEIVHDTCL